MTFTGTIRGTTESSGESVTELICTDKVELRNGYHSLLSSFYVLLGGCMASPPPANRSLSFLRTSFVRAVFVTVRAASLSITQRTTAPRHLI